MPFDHDDADCGGCSMKLAFSTIACPAWTWEHAIDQACALGYDGIEWRVIDSEVVTPDFPFDKAPKIAKTTAAAGLGVPALDSSIQLTTKPGEDRDRVLDGSRRMLRLAAALGAEHLRLFAGNYPESVSDADALVWTQEALVALQPEARDTGVRMALELHYCGWDRAGIRGTTSSSFLSTVLSSVDVPEAGLQWDIGNPFLESEPAEQTWDNVRERLTYLQVKDMLKGADKWTHALLGEGELPVDDMIRWVIDSGFDGWFSFEWEKLWHPKLAEPEVALPTFLTYMNSHHRG
jgi:sugar phosphate isomerase/epimerase